MPFRKRIYRNPKEFFSDLWSNLRHGRQLRQAREKGLVTPAFQERLMLAVTAVHGCRYCSYVHARQALKKGLEPAEINRLLAGDVDNCPEDEAVALIYAQHWAESDARPDPEAAGKLEQSYGAEKAKAINAVLRMIRVGNLAGNTWDYLLYRISCGRWRGD
ncbi:MAG: carboxymuconolactone decarboxylase family protein [Dehalococcoidia bacterium]|jgi:AhpD family alkylhydroperoxidase